MLVNMKKLQKLLSAILVGYEVICGMNGIRYSLNMLQPIEIEDILSQ